MKGNTTAREKRARTFGIRGWSVLGVGLALVASSAYYVYWSEIQHRFTTVTKHQLYRSARMEPEKLLSTVRENGIRSVIDLRTFADDAAGIEAERTALQDTEVKYLHLPTGHEPSQDTILTFLNFVGDPANRPVLVHCYHGTGRAVLFGSIYRIEFENWDNETARRAVEPLHWRGNFGPNSVKGKFLIKYEQHGTKAVFAASD